jgi:hypothetical protein
MRRRRNTVVCRRFASSRKLQQIIRLLSRGRGRWFEPSIAHSEDAARAFSRHNVSPAKRSVKLAPSWSAVVIRSVSGCVDRVASPEAGGPPPLPRPAIAASSSQQHQVMCLHALAPNGA